MKYLLLVVMLLYTGLANAQVPKYADSLPRINITETNAFLINEDLLNWPEQARLISVAGNSGQLLRTYAMDQDNTTISSGFMPNAYFRANDNFMVIKGDVNIIQDSLNPYGAKDMPSAILLGAINNFISKLNFGNKQ